MWKHGALASAPNEAGPLGVSGGINTHVQFDKRGHGANGVLAEYFSGNPSDQELRRSFRQKTASISAPQPGVIVLEVEATLRIH